MNAFLFSMWGKKYINDFFYFTAKCLKNNFKLIPRRELSNIKLIIWTSSKDKNLIFKKKNFKNLVN